MITSKNGQMADDANWVHGCFMVQVGTDFESYQQILTYALADESYDGGTATKPAVDPIAQKILNSDQNFTDSSLMPPIYFSKRKFRDSSLGGNDAINPLPQFCEDDDIGHPHYGANPNLGMTGGMGQVYSENYDDTQQILYLGFGIPVFSNIGNFWSSAVHQNMADFVNKGSGITAEHIGYLLGAAPIRAVKMATIPHKFIAGMVDSLEQVPITKYYSFSSHMPMYFRFVNTILVMLATNMNIMGSSTEFPSTGSVTTGTTATESLDINRTADDMSGFASIFSKSGLDMAQIMTRRFLFEQADSTIKNRWTDEALFDVANYDPKKGSATDQTTDTSTSTNTTPNATNSTTPTTAPNTDANTPAPDATAKFWRMGWFDAFKTAYSNAIYDGHLFIGFRIDKGMGTSESFSNSTGDSQVATLANQKFQEGRDASFSTMAGNFGDSGIAGMLSSVVGTVGAIFKGAADTLKIDPLAATLTGAAKVVIPEVWMNSSYSRSASFQISCLSPYGDMESIFMSEYVPLACMLAGTLPRGTGFSSHSSPFVCQAYCRGVFSSPLCIIESLEITRGADQFGFTANRLPLKLSMHVSLKDLTPAMYMSMGGDRGIASRVLGTDDNFGEYMLTLSGMGLRDRLSPFRSLRRKAEILMGTLYKNKLSPYMLGMEGGSRFMISRVISGIKSINGVSGLSGS